MGNRGIVQSIEVASPLLTCYSDKDKFYNVFDSPSIFTIYQASVYLNKKKGVYLPFKILDILEKYWLVLWYALVPFQMLH